MISNKEIKRRSLDSLKGNWALAIGIIVLSSIISSFVGSICSGVGGIASAIQSIISAGAENADMQSTMTGLQAYGGMSSILSTLVSFPLAVGSAYCFLNIVKGEKVNPSDLFTYFKSFSKYLSSIIISYVIGFITAIGFLLLIIPGIIAILGLSLSYYILIDNPEMQALDALKESWRMMKGHKMQLFTLNLSFIGWAILATIPLGLGWFVLSPYIYAANANFYRAVKGELNNDVNAVQA